MDLSASFPVLGESCKGAERGGRVNPGLQKKPLPVSEMAIFAKLNFREVSF